MIKPCSTSEPECERKKPWHQSKKSISYTSEPDKIRKTNHDNAIIHNPGKYNKKSKHEQYIAEWEFHADPLEVESAEHVLIDRILLEVEIELWICGRWKCRWWGVGSIFCHTACCEVKNRYDKDNILSIWLYDTNARPSQTCSQTRPSESHNRWTRSVSVTARWYIWPLR